MVGQLVSESVCHNFLLKGREVTLPCSYWNTCLVDDRRRPQSSVGAGGELRGGGNLVRGLEQPPPPPRRPPAAGLLFVQVLILIYCKILLTSVKSLLHC